ncbi:MAG: hypothetical protein KAR40_12100 [Candidatus Sabulitectum sp.]|nr:hypothetical protein [Candidatus Sabulitectum sp.]
MFDKNSREHLYDCASYEVFLIREVQEARALSAGKVTDPVYVIPDEGPGSISIEVSDCINAGGGERLALRLTPLILTSAFKILDQIWEWILTENSISPKGHFWSFFGKYDIFNTKPIVYPDFLKTDNDMQMVLKGMYQYLWPRRNVIIHSGWGILRGHDLHFDFEYKDVTQQNKPLVRINEVLSYDDVYTISEISRQFLELLCLQVRASQDRIVVIKVLSDKLASLHKANLFNEKRIAVFRVHRVTNLKRISVKKIRDQLKTRAKGEQFLFYLTVIDASTNDSFEVFSEDIPRVDELSLTELKACMRS